MKKSMDSQPQEVRLGLVGLGTVGSGVFEILKNQAVSLEKKTGVRLILQKIAVRSVSKKRAVSVPKALLTTDAMSVALDPRVDILIELIGGIRPAKEIILKALSSGKHVVTANKALLAEAGEEIFTAADANNRKIGFEASVCGGIPIIKSLREGLVSNDISQFLGIVNGTCNYILTRMSQEGCDFKTALVEAQAKGYAEENPALDVDGVDSAHKLAVLARLAFRSAISFKKIYVEGIRGLRREDIGYAQELGYAIKLLAVGKKHPKGLELRVHPTLLPNGHPLAGVRGVYNAVFIHADQAGDQLFYGRGAGKKPTASAVMSDVLDIARRNVSGSQRAKAPRLNFDNKKVLGIEETISKYYLRFQVADKPGVLGMIAKTLGQNEISILSVNQKESHATKSVPVIILTYAAAEKNIRKALKVIDASRGVSEKTIMMRVES